MKRGRRTSQDVTAGAHSRRGMTLFEVFVALAIFIGAMAVVSQIIHTGTLAGIQAQLVSDGVLRAESKLSEAVAGAVALQSGSGAFEDDPAWSWSLQVADGPQVNTLLLTLEASHSVQNAVNAKVHLSRLIRDPQIYSDAAGAATTSGLELLR